MNKFAKYVNTKNLKTERKKHKKNYEDMALAMNKKSKISYYNIEVGNVEPTISQMIIISKTLKKSVAYFFNIKVQLS